MNEFSNYFSNFHLMKMIKGISARVWFLPEKILKCFSKLSSCENDFGHGLYKLSDYSSNFRIIKKLLGINCKDMVYTLNEFSYNSSNIHLVLL